MSFLIDLSIKHSMICHFVSGSPRVDGDDDEDDVDDIENEFNYVQGSSKTKRHWQGEDAELSTSARHESQQPIPLLTNGQSVRIYQFHNAFGYVEFYIHGLTFCFFRFRAKFLVLPLTINRCEPHLVLWVLQISICTHIHMSTHGSQV